MIEPTPGRRERKKAATRQALADAALELFLERGYNGFTVRDVADAADVSTSTLFKYFASKEALLFDREGEQEQFLVTAVRDRPAGQSIPQALRELVLRAGIGIAGSPPDPRFARFLDLIEQTPALRAYSAGMWKGHQDALAHAIALESGAPEDDPGCAALARFVLETPSLARSQADPRRAVDAAFDLLEQGWTATRPTD